MKIIDKTYFYIIEYKKKSIKLRQNLYSVYFKKSDHLGSFYNHYSLLGTCFSC